MYMRGDWCRTLRALDLGGSHLPVCKEYTKPLGEWPPGEFVQSLPAEHVFGPVHAVMMSEDYIVVSVPRLDDPSILVWVIVQEGSTFFAHRIDVTWRWPEWRNEFLD